MASEIAKHFAEDVLHVKNVQSDITLQGNGGIQDDICVHESAETYQLRKRPEIEEEGVTSSSSYTLASNASQLSGDVDRWLGVSNTSAPSAIESAGIQGRRVATTQQSTRTSCQYVNSMWYLVAMVLPLFSVHNCVTQLRCTPSTVINTAEVLFRELAKLYGKVRAHVQRLGRDQLARDVFATAMDIVLVVYAVGFLVLSMYQASMIG